jgi:polysaccharide biosynthesis/export protein
LMQLLKAGDSRQDIALQEGDRVIVPTATAPLTAEDAAIVARATLSPASIRVNVVGEVEKPGVVEVPPNTTLNQALLAAGGFNGRARKRDVEFLRLMPNGQVDRRKVNIDLAMGLDERRNPGLQNYDTIVVGKSGIANIGTFLGNILAPFGAAAGFVNIFR